MIRSLMAVCTALLVQACSDPAHERLQDAKILLTNHLPDPHSARFEQIRLVDRPDGSKVLCGTLKAKNGFDTYDEPKGFFFLSHTEFGIEGQAAGGLVPAFCPS